MSTILEVFEKHLADVPIDDYFTDQVVRYATRFRTQNQEYMRFFGGVLLGVERIRFTPSHKDAWFTDVLQIDENALTRDLSKVPLWNTTTNRVASNGFNLSCCYLVYAIYHSKEIKNEKKREMGMLAALEVLHYKFICGLVARRFPHNADKAIALKAYDELTLKTAIRRMKSWHEYIDSRCDMYLSKSGTHFSRWSNFKPDAVVERFVRDVNTGIRAVINRITDTYYQMYEEGKKIGASSQTVELDDGIVVRDVTKSEAIYRQYLFEIVYDPNTFIKNELVNLVVDMHTTTNAMTIKQALLYISQNSGKTTKAGKEVDRMLNLTMEHAIEYLSLNKVDTKNLTFLFFMRNVYTSNRTSNAKLLELRKIGTDVIRQGTTVRSDADISAARTGVLLYILLRTFSRNFYIKRTRLR